MARIPIACTSHRMTPIGLIVLPPNVGSAEAKDTSSGKSAMSTCMESWILTKLIRHAMGMAK